MRLLLARHGLTEWNSSHRYQGQQDVPLSPAGMSQACALSRRLESEHLDAVYSSDLSRAQETALTVVQRHPGLPVSIEPRLRELSFGAWEGLTHAEIEQAYPLQMAAWIENTVELAPPGGESMHQMGQRVQAVLDQLLRLHSGQTVLLVAHGGPLQILICLALGLPLQHYWQFRLANASLSEIAFYPAGGSMQRFNDTWHLESDKWEN